MPHFVNSSGNKRYWYALKENVSELSRHIKAIYDFLEIAISPFIICHNKICQYNITKNINSMNSQVNKSNEWKIQFYECFP